MLSALLLISKRTPSLPKFLANQMALRSLVTEGDSSLFGWSVILFCEIFEPFECLLWAMTEVCHLASRGFPFGLCIAVRIFDCDRATSLTPVRPYFDGCCPALDAVDLLLAHIIYILRGWFANTNGSMRPAECRGLRH